MNNAAKAYAVEYRGWGGYGWVWYIALTTDDATAKSKNKAERRAQAIRREGRVVRVRLVEVAA